MTFFSSVFVFRGQLTMIGEVSIKKKRKHQQTNNFHSAQFHFTFGLTFPPNLVQVCESIQKLCTFLRSTPPHQISAKRKNCDAVWDFSRQTSFFFILTGRLRSGGETLPRPPLAEPRQSHQQHLWAPQPGEGGERHKGRPHRGPRWVRPSQSGQY